MLVSASPQVSGATAVYSMVLIGERLESGDVRAVALGGSTQLVTDSLSVLQTNPALLGGLKLVSIAATQFLAVDEARSEEYNERDISYVFPAFRAAFPIAGLFVFSVGYVGRFDPDGSFETRGVTQSGDIFTRRFTKLGGLFSIPFTISADITDYASLGLTVSLEKGFVEERWDTEFDDPALAPSAGRQKEELDGTGFAGGIALRPLSGLVVGGMFESEVDYDTDIKEQFTQSSLDTSFTSTVKLPARASVGVTWGVTESVLLLGSFSWSDFTKFRGLAFPTTRLGKETAYAFGFEYDGVSIFGRRFPIRLSLNYQELPFDHPAGRAVEKFLVGFGTGLTILDGKGKFDVAFSGGKIGAIGDNGVEDRVFRLYIGVSGGEVWRRRGGGGL
jgi:hypothetical protein